MEFVRKGVKFFTHCVIELFLVGPAHCHLERWVVIIVLVSFSLEEAGVRYVVEEGLGEVGGGVGDDVAVQIGWGVKVQLCCRIAWLVRCEVEMFCCCGCCRHWLDVWAGGMCPDESKYVSS